MAEADESDGAFLVYSPFGALVTNVEADHLDNYGTEEAYHAAFTTFLDRIDPDGFLVACIDDDGAADLAEQARDKGLTVVGIGESERADLRAEGLEFEGATSRFTVVDRGRRLGVVALQIPGRHYVLDALAALAAGLRLGFGFEELRRGLEAFTGTRRRMEFKGQAAGVRVYDSYAHHPNEIVGDLQAARSLAGEGRVVVAFQPHLVSRTKIFGPAMGAALGAADEVVVMDVYVAREDPEPGINGRLVASHVPLSDEHVHFEPSWSRTPAALVERARPGDLVLTLGAGDVTLVGPEVLELLGGARVMSLFTRDRHDVDGPDEDDDVERTVRIARKRFARRQWTRRWLAWRRVVVVVALLALVAGSLLLVFASSVLSVSGVRVQGTEVLDPAVVRRAAAVPTGTPLATVDLDAVSRRVQALPAVLRVDVSRSWPNASASTSPSARRSRSSRAAPRCAASTRPA